MENALEFINLFETLQATKYSLRDEFETMCSVCDDFEREYRSLDGIMKIHNEAVEDIIEHLELTNSKMSEVVDDLAYSFDKMLSVMNEFMNTPEFQLELEIARAQAKNRNNKTSE